MGSYKIDPQNRIPVNPESIGFRLRPSAITRLRGKTWMSPRELVHFFRSAEDE